ncbi:tyrosine-type recombinase/integrase [Caballeronia sp. LZ065]|uniref:tyrosine-type recombinase/integrase n=1 Tax=Caballeronia sp. LZ065 TaxID=3038571 RepID=UPI00285A3A9A|nr:integrase arm-type DNA-binding domain-containing protein [Caballeronia sp. LZ065]MDR5778783.1 tyrosine-type recombinase/integrase [Caballeronia sp. LZ065]
MPKKAKELGPLAVSRLNEPGKHAVGGVDGLYLSISDTGAGYWVLRATIAGKRREIGLGAYSAKGMGVAEARAAALEKREEIKRGVDPVMQRKEAASQLRAGQALEMTFEKTAERYIAAKEVEWRNSKHGAQWTYTLAEYAHPIIGKMQVRHVTRSHVLEILEPIWQAKTETASRLRGRIEAILDYARVKGFRDEGVNPAAWRGNLDKLLSAPKKTKRVRNHPALPIVKMGAFMKTLRAIEGVSARCLEFSILTAARSGEARAADWREIDLEKGIWSVPAEKMKARKEHRVPLPAAAVRLLKAIERQDDVDLVFPSPRSNRALSDMSLLAIMRRQGLEATPHGFRSTFRDWASEYTNYPRELAEVALAHIKGDATEAAYWRSDVLQKRRRLMEDWAAFCDKVIEEGAVIPLNKKA